MPKPKQVATVADYLEGIKTLIHSERHSHKRYWFRGQRCCDWKLIPGVYREGFSKTEGDRRNNELHLFQDFKIDSSPLLKGSESNEQIYFLHQHFRLPTRLLDWTLDPLAALYFAAEDAEGWDGKVVMMDAYLLSKKGDGRYMGMQTASGPNYRKSIKALLDWENKVEYPDLIFGVRPEKFIDRIRLQSGCFTFHVPKNPELTTENNNTLRTIEIPNKCKRDLRRELRLLGFTPFRFYGDLESLALTLKTAYGITNPPLKKRGP